MSSYAASIKTAQELIRDKIMEKLRRDPQAYGRVSVEVTIQGGKIQTIQAAESTTVKPSL